MMEERDRRSSGSGWHHPTPTPALEILLATSSFIKTNKSLLIEAKVSQEFSYFLSQYMQACDDLKHLEFHNRFCHVKKFCIPVRSSCPFPHGLSVPHHRSSVPASTLLSLRPSSPMNEIQMLVLSLQSFKDMPKWEMQLAKFKGKKKRAY